MTTTHEYQVTGMTCGHCEMSVREEGGELSGVTDIQVSAQTGRLLVTSEGPLGDAPVLPAVAQTGDPAVKGGGSRRVRGSPAARRPPRSPVGPASRPAPSPRTGLAGRPPRRQATRCSMGAAMRLPAAGQRT